MERRDPVQLRTERDSSSREVVDWNPETRTGTILRWSYPVIAWGAVLASVALVFWLGLSALQSLGLLGRIDQQVIVVGTAFGAVGLTVSAGLLSPRSPGTGPPLGGLLTSESPLAQAARLAIVACGAVVFGLQLVVAEFVFVTEPIIVAFIGLSVLPALALVLYIRRADVTAPDPPLLLVLVFVLGLLLANIAAVVNTAVDETGLLSVFSDQIGSSITLFGFFLLVVAPIEELVKLLAASLYTYRYPQFDAVVAGAVYGAFAGLGFATIENAIFITETVATADSGSGAVSRGSSITVGRAFAGPGHVIWSSLAGYYLGMARYNTRFAGPLICKGLLIVVVLHGVYNLSVQFLIAPVASALGLPFRSVFAAFAVLFHGLAFGFLLYKLFRYRDAHRDAANGSHIESELAEFDP